MNTSKGEEFYIKRKRPLFVTGIVTPAYDHVRTLDIKLCMALVIVFIFVK